jgi:hypothetical protein
MPFAINEAVSTYTKKIKKYEALEKPLKFSYDELVVLLAVEYMSVHRVSVKKAETPAWARRTQCVRCGSHEHKAGDKTEDGKPVCTARCSDCGSRICSGCRPGGTCVVMADEMPPMSELKNGAGELYRPEIYNQLVEYRNKKRAGLGMAVKVTRVDAAVGEGDSVCEDADEDPYDQYHLF